MTTDVFMENVFPMSNKKNRLVEPGYYTNERKLPAGKEM
jgi:hypothetical protein